MHERFSMSLEVAGRTLGALRTAIGAVTLIYPPITSEPWVGKKASRRTATKVFARTLGGRDLALGVGALLARVEHGELRRWVLFGALADACDAAATIAAYRDLPKPTRAVVLSIATSAAVAGAVVAVSMNENDSLFH